MEIILGKTAGFCYGVKKAVEGARNELKNTQEDLYCLGEIVHNEKVVNELRCKGLKFIEKIEDAKGKTIVRAHGIQKEIYEKAKKAKIDLCDYTCPKVLRIHEIAEEYARKGYYIFLCGSKTHPENIGTISFCGENYNVIEEIEDVNESINEFYKSNCKKLLIIAQTTYSLDKFMQIENLIKEQVPKMLKIKNTICKATKLRQLETKKISKEVDYMIIIGGQHSSNTKKLFEIAKENCKSVVCIQKKEDIDIEQLKDCNKIGVMAGASTPQECIDEVIDLIENIDNAVHI